VGLSSLLPGLAGAAGAKFPIGAAAKSGSKPVEITMWHSMTSNNLKTLTALADQFNASQKNVHVNLVAQISYTDTETAYTTALSGGTSKLPDLLQWESGKIQTLIDSQSVVPVSAAIAADRFSLSDFVPSMLNFFKVKGTLWALPFNISNQVLYFNEKAFTQAGLDPANPPTTLAQLRSAAQKIVSSGTSKYGMSLKANPSSFELFMSLGNKTIVNKNNGRSGRATAATFGNALGKSIFTWWSGMLKDNLAQSTSNTTFDNLLAIGSGIAPMTLETSAALGTILGVLSQYPNVQLGIGPVPSPSGPVKGGGVFLGGAGLYIVKKPSPATQDAAWQFIKYLTTPASQATWAVGTGYVPVRRTAVLLPNLVQAWTNVPGYRVPYKQLLSSPVDPATAGYVSGAATQIDNAIQDAIASLANGAPPGQALAQAVSAANDAITSYNQRV